MDTNSSNNYEVEFTQECMQEMKRVYDYIKDNLKAEKSAKRIMNMIEEITTNLVNEPRMYMEIPQYRGTNEIYRRIVIKNYVLLYTIDEEKRKIFIAHMYYGGRNYLE